MANLLRDPKFWTAIVAAVFNLALFFVGKYVPTMLEDVKFLIATIDPILAIIIGALFIQAKLTAMQAEIKVLSLAAKINK